MASFIRTGDAIGPADLTVARIRRASPSIDREAGELGTTSSRRRSVALCGSAAPLPKRATSPRR